MERAITQAQANDLVVRNVATLATLPQGREGRRSKSFTVDQAKAVLAAAEGTRLHAYVAVSLLVGIRTEEARALRWDHVVTWADDTSGWRPVTEVGFVVGRAPAPRFAIYVWQSARHGADTKTEKSRRTPWTEPRPDQGMHRASSPPTSRNSWPAERPSSCSPRA